MTYVFCHICESYATPYVDYHILWDYIHKFLASYTNNIEAFGRSTTLRIRWAISIRGLKGKIHKINRLETEPVIYEYRLTSARHNPTNSNQYFSLFHTMEQLYVALIGESL